MNVLHVAPAFYPALFWGGPTTSVYELCNHLARIPDVDLRVLTTDTSGPASADRLTKEQQNPGQYSGYAVHFCRKLVGVDFTPSLWWRVWPHIAWADVVHLTSVYSTTTMPTLLAARLFGKPVVWSPRGALQRWEGSSNLRLKSVWESICRLLLPGNARLHATSEDEAMESTKRLGGLDALVVPNGVSPPDSVPVREWVAAGCLKVLFLGRLDRKKGIENLLQAISALPNAHASLEICGEGKPDYLKSLQVLAHHLGIADRVRFLGGIAGVEKAQAFFRADVCVVPSYTENFAMVVAESLAHATPVVASTGVPWKPLQVREAGWWVPNDPASLVRTLESARGADLAAMGQRGRNWMIDQFSWRSIAARMVEAYRVMVMGERSRTPP